MNEPDESGRRRADLTAAYQRYARDPGVQNKWSSANPGNRAIVRELERVRNDMLAPHVPSDGVGVVLDLGCGSASIVPHALGDHRLLLGAELLVERIAPARAHRLHDAYIAADGSALPFRSSSIDVVILSTVLSSIPDAGIRWRVGHEIERVVPPGGFVVLYDIRLPNPRNRNTVPITRRELRRIFPMCELRLRSVTLVPQVARRLGRRTDTLYPILAAVPLLRTHNVGVLVRN